MLSGILDLLMGHLHLLPSQRMSLKVALHSQSYTLKAVVSGHSLLSIMVGLDVSQCLLVPRLQSKQQVSMYLSAAVFSMHSQRLLLTQACTNYFMWLWPDMLNNSMVPTVIMDIIVGNCEYRDQFLKIPAKFFSILFNLHIVVLRDVTNWKYWLFMIVIYKHIMKVVDGDGNAGG